MNTIDQIKATLETLKPALQMDGGDVEFVSFDEADGLVRVALQGACAHCPMSSITLKHYIEDQLQQAIPEVKSVIQV